jgi:hypothetical protein
MRINLNLWLIVLAFVSVTIGYKLSSDHALLHRLIRATSDKKTDCRYEKEAWEECDPSNGLQRRELKLKANSRSGGSSSSECEPVRYITRPCKKSCRYNKGEWSECVNGERSRTDTIKPQSTAGCEQSRVITKKCKSVCRYSKSEWSPCESGIKTKTLTLIEGEGPDCEQSKVINKQCQQNKRAKHGKQRGRKSNGSGANGSGGNSNIPAGGVGGGSPAASSSSS